MADTTPDPTSPHFPPRPPLRHRIREKLPELLLEAVSVVFAVLLALGVDEWRDNRARHAFAVRAQESLLRELRANREELTRIQERNRPYLESLREQVKALEKKETLREIGVHVQLAQLSSAAWQTAQSTEAPQLLDFKWLVDVAGTYEIQKLYVQSQAEILSRIGDVAAADTQAARLSEMRQIASRLSLLMTLAGQLSEAYDAVVKATPQVP